MSCNVILSHDTIISTNWVAQNRFGGRNYARASAYKVHFSASARVLCFFCMAVFCIIMDVNKINILVPTEKELELPKEFRLNSGAN